MSAPRSKRYLPDLDTGAGPVWSAPYLETCCRAALHRLMLAGTRPVGTMDEACLSRLVALGLAAHCDGGFSVTEVGRARHAAEIVRRGDWLARHKE